ncbi:MAG: phenylalanine--tRNA ligase subunit alpha [Candidatus Latescibacteria bacterium]|nr:phenylalanine--tRNA ligase subunit alpha [Candidatus Latescibacterota bacterium]
MQKEIEALVEAALGEIAGAADTAQLDEIQVRYLGRKSRLTEISRQIGTVEPEQRPILGQAFKGGRKTIEDALGQRASALQQAVDADEAFDMTLPGRRPLAGKLHPLSLLTEQVSDIFCGMGFTLADGPEIEDEYHNFDALNTPADHPSRDLHDTFYLEDGRLLRTQTSTVQIRIMEQRQPPIRIISPGRCYRRDTVDATHHFVFHQIEGLYVDEGVSLADLKGTLIAMGQQLLGEQTQIRLRPHFFPFTEPSVEYDFSCSICAGNNASCRVCKGTGWIEIGGAGMVDPGVFEAVGYDAERYTGFAFGLGIDRMAMMLHAIDDIRLFLENDLRFIRQF